MTKKELGDGDVVMDASGGTAGGQTLAVNVPVACESVVQKAKDRRYCSMQMVLSHVVRNQEMVRCALDAEFSFTCVIDAVSNAANMLAVAWGTRTFCVVDHANVEAWIRKAYSESQRQEVESVVCLCPARTNTEYFHDIVLKHGSEVRFIKGRLKMQGHARQSPFPSCVVIFGEKRHQEGSGAPVAFTTNNFHQN